jgi:hypothetical protein
MGNVNRKMDVEWVRNHNNNGQDISLEPECLREAGAFFAGDDEGLRSDLHCSKRYKRAMDWIHTDTHHCKGQQKRQLRKLVKPCTLPDQFGPNVAHHIAGYIADGWRNHFNTKMVLGVTIHPPIHVNLGVAGNPNVPTSDTDELQRLVVVAPSPPVVRADMDWQPLLGPFRHVQTVDVSLDHFRGGAVRALWSKLATMKQPPQTLHLAMPVDDVEPQWTDDTETLTSLVAQAETVHLRTFHSDTTQCDGQVPQLARLHELLEDVCEWPPGTRIANLHLSLPACGLPSMPALPATVVNVHLRYEPHSYCRPASPQGPQGSTSWDEAIASPDLQFITVEGITAAPRPFGP